MKKSSAKERLLRNTIDLNTITVTTASGTGHIFVQLLPTSVAKLGCRLEAVVTVLYTPDEWCG